MQVAIKPGVQKSGSGCTQNKVNKTSPQHTKNLLAVETQPQFS